MYCFLFNGLTPQEAAELSSLLEAEVTAQKGDELYKDNHIGILVSGSATVSRIGDSGEKVDMRSMSGGEIFGSASVFGSWKVGYSSITAKQECRIIYISEEDFKEIIYRFPAVAYNYIQFLTDRIRFLNRKIDTFSAGSTEGKIYEFLLSVCDGDGVVKKNLSMAEIARRLKIGRSSLYRGIDSLEEKGLITKDNQTFKVNK